MFFQVQHDGWTVEVGPAWRLAGNNNGELHWGNICLVFQCLLLLTITSRGFPFPSCATSLLENGP